MNNIPNMGGVSADDHIAMMLKAADDQDYTAYMTLLACKDMSSLIGFFKTLKIRPDFLSLRLKNISDQKFKSIDESLINIVTEIDQPAIPVLIAEMNYRENESYVWAVLLLEEIGTRALSSLLAEYEKDKTDHRFDRLLNRLGWAPEDHSERITFYLRLGKQDEIIKIGAAAIPELSKRWQSEKFDYERAKLAKVLCALQWEPDQEIEKILFYGDTEQWDKLLNIGAPAVDTFIRLEREQELIKLGHAAIPRLVEPLQNSYCSYDKDRIEIKVLVALGWEPEGLDEQSQINFYRATEQWQKLIQIGLPAVKALSDGHRFSDIVAMGELAVRKVLYSMDREQSSVGYASPEPKRLTEKKKLLANVGKPLIPILLRLLDDSGEGNKDFYERITAKSQALQILKQIVWSPVELEDKLLFYKATENYEELAKLGEHAVPIIAKGLKDNRYKDAVDALVTIGEAAVPHLVDKLKLADYKVKVRIAECLVGCGNKAALLETLKILPELNIEDSELLAERLGILIHGTSDKDLHQELKKAINTLFSELYNRGTLCGMTLQKLGADNDKIVDSYIDLLSRIERPKGYWPILQFFVDNKSSRAARPLIRLINIPKLGLEEFYKDIVRTIGRIGDRSVIPELISLMYATWRVEGRIGGSQFVDSSWIKPELQKAIEILEKSDIAMASSAPKPAHSSTASSVPEKAHSNAPKLPDKAKRRWWEIWK